MAPTSPSQKMALFERARVWQMASGLSTCLTSKKHTHHAAKPYKTVPQLGQKTDPLVASPCSLGAVSYLPAVPICGAGEQAQRIGQQEDHKARSRRGSRPRQGSGTGGRRRMAALRNWYEEMVHEITGE